MLTLATSRLRLLRNTLLPVNTLPPEILTSIFRTLSSPKTHSSPSTEHAVIPHKAKPREWIPITHVCRYWRDTALGYPFLWSPIVFEPADIRNENSLPYECLHRSLGAPLDVQIKCGESSDDQVWDKLSARCGRLRKFHVVDLLDVNSLEKFRGEAPILQSLQLQVNYKLIDQRDDGETLDGVLPPMFAGHTPALRYLTLSFFTSYSSNHFENLAELRLSDQLYHASSELSHLIALLESSPNLEELSLTKCNISSAEEEMFLATSPVQERPLPMYRLQRLAFIECHASIISEVLARLELSSEGVAIVCRGWEPSERSLTSIFPPKHRSRIYPLSDISTLDLTYDDSEIIATGPSTTVRLTFDDDMDVADEIAPSLPFVFPLHTLRELRIAGIELRGSDFWQHFFGTLPALSKLALWLPPTDSDKWLIALSSEALNGRPYPVPVLSELCIFPPFPAIWDTLTWLAQSRAKDGHSIARIRIMCHTGTRDASIRRAFEGWKADSAALEGFVEEVVFDTVEQYCSKDVPEMHRTFVYS